MKKYMPLEGLRWSRDSGSALCDTSQNSRSRTGWGGKFCCFLSKFCNLGVALLTNETPKTKNSYLKKQILPPQPVRERPFWGVS